MIILSVDPGYDRCGLAVIEKTARGDKLLASACVSTNPKDDYPKRLKQVGDAVEQYLKEWRPDAVALEKLFFATNRKTANQVSEVRGMIIFLAARAGKTIYEYTPLQIKQTVAGFGQASKKQVAQMVKRLVTLTREPDYDDEYDAIAVGLTASAHLRFQ